MAKSTYVYGYGYKSMLRACNALEDMFAAGEVSNGENPKIERRTVNGKSSFAIVLEAYDPD